MSSDFFERTKTGKATVFLQSQKKGYAYAHLAVKLLTPLMANTRVISYLVVNPSRLNPIPPTSVQSIKPTPSDLIDIRHSYLPT
jgi:hypothetical protein